MAVKDTLPIFGGPTEFPLFGALNHLSYALHQDSLGDKPGAVHGAKYALANIRAWRETLPDQGDRTFDSDLDDRALLRAAMRAVLYADSAKGPLVPVFLREAEAALRTLIKRHRSMPALDRS